MFRARVELLVLLVAFAALPAVAGAAKAPIKLRDLKPISRNLEKEPRVPRQREGRATKLLRKDIVKGTGAAARSGDQLTVQYTGYVLSDGKQIDSSWGRAEPLVFALGTGQVIAGWDRGLVGMKVGGRRELVIPARLAYGRDGVPPVIGPRETLIFVVDLKSVG